jgi:hypothetical protein
MKDSFQIARGRRRTAGARHRLACERCITARDVGRGLSDPHFLGERQIEEGAREHSRLLHHLSWNAVARDDQKADVAAGPIDCRRDRALTGVAAGPVRRDIDDRNR